MSVRHSLLHKPVLLSLGPLALRVVMMMPMVLLALRVVMMMPPGPSGTLGIQDGTPSLPVRGNLYRNLW